MLWLITLEVKQSLVQGRTTPGCGWINRKQKDLAQNDCNFLTASSDVKRGRCYSDQKQALFHLVLHAVHEVRWESFSMLWCEVGALLPDRFAAAAGCWAGCSWSSAGWRHTWSTGHTGTLSTCKENRSTKRTCVNCDKLLCWQKWISHFRVVLAFF